MEIGFVYPRVFGVGVIGPLDKVLGAASARAMFEDTLNFVLGFLVVEQYRFRGWWSP